MDDGKRLIQTVLDDLNASYMSASRKVTVGVVVVAGFAVWRLIQHFRWRRCPGHYSMSGKTVLITGANSGIGKATALEMAKRDAKVILACRNLTAAESAVEYIRRRTSRGELLTKYLDLSSFMSIRSFARDVEMSEAKLDVLINNAGVYGCPLEFSADGFEMHFAVNYLGHYLLTNLLTNQLKQTAGSRVVVVTSGYYNKGKLDFENGLDKMDPYNGRQAYSNTKLANMLFGIELNHRLEGYGVKVYMVSPGIVWTNLGRHIYMPWWKKVFLLPFILMFVKSPNEGCQTVVYCSAADEVEDKAGRFFKNCQEVELDSKVINSLVAKRLWDVSATLAKVA